MPKIESFVDILCLINAMCVNAINAQAKTLADNAKAEIQHQCFFFAEEAVKTQTDFTPLQIVQLKQIHENINHILGETE